MRGSSDVVWPVVHGAWGEHGLLQRALADAGVECVGTPPAAAELASNKLRWGCRVRGDPTTACAAIAGRPPGRAPCRAPCPDAALSPTEIGRASLISKVSAWECSLCFAPG